MCYHLNGSYDKAAAALRFGDLYDHLIVYVNEYKFPSNCSLWIKLITLIAIADTLTQNHVEIMVDFAIFCLNKAECRRIYVLSVLDSLAPMM